MDQFINVEIKARCEDSQKVRNILRGKYAEFKGIDNQIDTYFKSNNGRLKLREGNIENYLIFYERENDAGPQQSKVMLFKTEPKSLLKQMLEKAIGILTIVNKKREIYFIDNVKFHIDSVEGLGTFVEIEARDTEGTLGEAKLREQCENYMTLLGIRKEDLLDSSYSDLLYKFIG